MTSSISIASVRSYVAGMVVMLGLAQLVCADEPVVPENRVDRSTASGSIDALAKLAAAPAADRQSHWQKGEVLFRDEWRTPDSVAEALMENPDYDAYRKRRETCAETADGHFKLALWSRSRGLEEEGISHLRVAARLAPTDQRLRRALETVERRGKVAVESAAALAHKQAAVERQAYETWKRRLTALRLDLDSGQTARSSDAQQQIRTIRDPLAIGAMEEVLSMHSGHAALPVLEALDGILHIAATRSLVRHAVWHPSESIRQAAVTQLKQRQPEHYVGALIHLLRPSATGEIWTQLPDGRPARVWYMQDYDTEIQDVTVFDAGRPWSPGGARNDRRTRSRMAELQARNQVRWQNAHAALVATTGEDFGLDQSAWIEWWSDVTYVDPAEYSTPTRSVETTWSYGPASAFADSHSCFVAGTPVWTRRGLVPIDHVRLGDLVLSMNVETGELAYRPVLDCTIRHTKKTMLIETGGEQIGATEGHPFWIPGAGWKRARDLNAGDPLQSAGQSTPVNATKEGEDQQVYNLVVADFHTYFVGRTRVLVHDITPIASHQADAK